ncbi:MAG: 3-keto-disaccharide hydrolase [Phycisphaerales bacterium]
MLSTILAVCAVAVAQQSQSDPRYTVHDMSRPQPPVVSPGAPSTQAKAGTAPSDAIVLFDGKDLSKWRTGNGDAAWKIVDGVIEVAAGTGSLTTRDAFADCHLHLEWMVPTSLKPNGQQGCNSGVFFMEMYEVQILHSNGNVTYPDGMAGSLYGQYPPLVNACRPQGEWNTYDIIFTAPRFNDDGSVKSPASCTVLFNGLVVQNHVEFFGRTAHMRPASYSKHPDRLPISIQDHGDALRFRNIWVRPLGG